MPVKDPPYTIHDDYSSYMWIASRDVTSGQDLGGLYVGADATPFTEYVLFLTFLVGQSGPSTAVQDATDRLRSVISEDTGSLLDSVEARAVDASVSVDFTNAVTLEPLTLTNYRDALRAGDSATVDATFYPRPVQNTAEEQQFDGITLLSRLATWYPPQIVDTVVNLGIVSSGSATAQQVIQYVLDEWETLADWFTAETVPDLRLRIAGYAPGDYGATDGLVTTETVHISQLEENRRTARQILDDLLSPFPGTVVRQNSSGNLELVPVYGPDADATAHLTLSNDDVYSVSQGKPDPWGITNRCTFTSQGYARQDEVALMQAAWFQVGSNYQLGKDTWYSPPSDRLNLQPPSNLCDTLQECLVLGDFAAQRPQLWPLGSDNIPAGTGISLRDGSNNPTITCAWSRYNDTTLQDSGAGALTLIRDDIPFDGVWRNTFRWDEGSQYVVMAARWNASRGGVELGIYSAFLESGCITGCKGWVVEFTLNDSSVGYAEGLRRTATFGIVDNGDTLPSSTGNAVEESQTAYGVLEKTVNVRGYDLDAATLAEAAQSFVIENITPRVTRDLDVSTWGVGVTFDAIGRLIELPSGEQGVLTSVEYADDFTARSMRRTARVQIKNDTGTGAIDEDAETFVTTKGGNDYLATTAGEIYETTG